MIKKIILTASQTFGGVVYHPGEYDLARFIREAGEEKGAVLWERFKTKAERHYSSCPAIKIEVDKTTRPVAADGGK